MDYYFYDYDAPQYEDEEEIIIHRVERNFYETWMNCINPSLHQITAYIGTFLLLTLVFRILCSALPTFTQTRHFISAACGLTVLYVSVGQASTYFVAFTIFNYLVLICLPMIKVKRLGLTLGSVCIAILVLFELLDANPKLWHQIRGIQMLGAMKVISLAFDIDARKIDRIPNFLGFMGYLFCPANCVLGPWVPYDEYIAAFSKNISGIRSIRLMIVNTILSIVFVLLSNCLVSMLVPDGSWKWFVAYRDALAFRCSHYFVSFLSQATMAASGFTNRIDEPPSAFGYQVTNPIAVEFPRSLVQVVVNWNIPMHKWLKTYIFRIIKPRSTSLAIFMTYLISSLLHGLNFQLAAVLLSLGFYTYVEYSLRRKIGTIFNACVLTSTCKSDCNHEYKWNNTFVIASNAFFSILTIVHLAYLGVMFEASSTVQEQGFSLQHALSKWQLLNFFSHWVIVCCYVFYLLI